MIIKIAVAVFLMLFTMNWLCLLSSQKIKGFRYGDFVIVTFFLFLVICNLNYIQEAGAVVSYHTGIVVSRVQNRWGKVTKRIDESRESIRVATEFLKGMAGGKLEEKMKFTAPR